MKALVLGTVVGAITLGNLGCSQSKPNQVAHPQEARQSTAQPPASAATLQLPTASEVFRLRSECAKLGEKILAEHPSGNTNFTDSQISRYNPATNRCFVELEVQNADLSKPLVLHRTLWDGQTGELLASMETDCTGATDMTKCKRFGSVFGSGIDMIQGNKALANTDNETLHDSASEPEAFINNVMVDDRKQ
jgi:hypothetical protein